MAGWEPSKHIILAAIGSIVRKLKSFYRANLEDERARNEYQRGYKIISDFLSSTYRHFGVVLWATARKVSR